MPCSVCEQYPERLQGSVDIHFWPPLNHSADKLATALAVPTELLPDGRMVARMTYEAFEQVAQTLGQVLSIEERRGIRVLMLPAGQAPGLGDVRAIRSLEGLIGLIEATWLIEAVRNGQTRVDLAPIVHADDTSERFGAIATLEVGANDGRPLSGARDIYETAARAGLLFQVDCSCRLAAIDAMAAAGEGVTTFIPFAPASIYDPAYCLRSTVAAVEKHGLKHRDVVFTVASRDPVRDPEHLRNVLNFYRDAGFPTALAEIGGAFGSFDLLQMLRPDYLVLASTLTDGIARDPYRDVIARKVLEIAQRLDIETLATEIDRAEDADWLYRHGINYLSGSFTTVASDHG